MAEMANVVGGEIITDEWGNLIRSRTVQRYATVAARTAGHPSPTAGDLSYLQDSGDLDVYHGGTWKHVGPPVGAVQMLAGGSVPNGWLVCNGSAVSRTTYAALFTALSDTWGAGDGSTTFNLPDMRGRYPRGVATTGEGDGLGESFGSDAIPHTHTVDPPNWATSPATGGGGSNGPQMTGNVSEPSHVHEVNMGTFGSGSPEQTSILPASKAIHFIIKT